MIRKSILMIFCFLPALTFTQDNQNQHKLFTEILNDYVVDGMVNYKKLKEDERLDEYITQLEKTNPTVYKTRDEKIAFWINAYNAFTLKFIVDEYPVESINDLHWGGLYVGTLLGTTVWDDDKIKINSKMISLNDIEHKILRGKYKERRIHFAVVCASISCPTLRSEAYAGYKLNNQLNDQAYKFFNDESKNKFDSKNRIAYLSKILDWYANDFGSSKQEILLYVSQFLNDKLRNYIRGNVDGWNIDYLDYNWDLNDLK